MGPDSRLALNIEVSSQQIGQPSRDGQTKSETGEFPPRGAIHLLEGFEHAFNLIPLDSNPGVDDF
jgi:hypothetical protein